MFHNGDGVIAFGLLLRSIFWSQTLLTSEAANHVLAEDTDRGMPMPDGGSDRFYNGTGRRGGIGPSSALLPFGQHPPCGTPAAIAQSSARSATDMDSGPARRLPTWLLVSLSLSTIMPRKKGDDLTDRERRLFLAATKALSLTGVSLDIAAREFAAAWQILGGEGIIEAAHFYKKHHGAVLPRISVADAAERFRVAKKAGGASPKYLKAIRHITGRLAACFQCDIKSITTDDLAAYLEHLNAGPITKNNHRRVLVSLFNHAKDQGWLSKGEATAASALKVNKVKRRPPKIFTPKEMGALLSNASERFRPYLVLVAFGGLRSDEITDDEPQERRSRGQLRWENIDFAQRCIIVPKSVSKSFRRKILMSDNLLAWLEPYEGRTGYIYDLSQGTIADRRAWPQALRGRPTRSGTALRAIAWRRRGTHARSHWRWETLPRSC
jgi:hypothetical protein